MLKTKFTLSRALIVYIQLFANIMIVKLLEGSLKLISFSLFFKDNDECKSYPCDWLASCSDSPGSYLCKCRTGYMGDGFNCQGTL